MRKFGALFILAVALVGFSGPVPWPCPGNVPCSVSVSR
jgi:hypothetical protein